MLKISSSALFDVVAVKVVVAFQLRDLCDSFSITYHTDALDAILTYSESAKQLLRRKKVKREHIFMYLTEKKVLASSQADKPTLVRKVLKYWAETDISPSARDHEVRRTNAEKGETLSFLYVIFICLCHCAV